MRRIIIGVMGPGEGATAQNVEHASKLGQLIAKAGWVLLCGGRDTGVMDAVSKGAQAAGGLTIGILPTANNDHTSEGIDLAILTGLGSARNNINVLSSDVVIACGMGAGTASEVTLALKAKKDVILLTDNDQANALFSFFGKELVTIAASPEEAIALTKKLLVEKGPQT